MRKSEVIDSVQELLSDKSAAMRTLVGRWVNIVLQDISSRNLLNSLKVEESTPLVVGQQWYALPVGVDHIYKLFVPAWGEELLKKSDDDYLRLRLQEPTPGRPTCYNIFGVGQIMAIRLHPIPDLVNAPLVPTEYQKMFVWMYKQVESLVESDEIVEIKTKHIPTILYGAYALGAKFDSILDAADATIKYERGIGRIAMDNNLELGRPQQVKYYDLG